MPHSDISATTAAFATLCKPEINRRGFARPAPPSRAYRLRHVTITITNMFSKYGKLSGPSSFCPFGKVLRVLWAQIVLCSHYSGSVKELRWLLQPVLRNVSLKKCQKKNRKDVLLKAISEAPPSCFLAAHWLPPLRNSLMMRLKSAPSHPGNVAQYLAGCMGLVSGPLL